MKRPRDYWTAQKKHDKQRRVKRPRYRVALENRKAERAFKAQLLGM